MSRTPVPTAHSKPAALTLAALATAAIAGAVLAVLAGPAFLISLAARRPLIATAARRWPWLSGPANGPRTQA